MTAYAVADDVLLRAGRVAGAFTVTGKRPNLADISSLLTDVSAEIDVEIRAQGYDPALLDTATTGALKDIAAYGVLARALAAIDPSDRPDNVKSLIDRAESVWSSDPSSDRRGATLSRILLLLEAGAGGGGAGSSAGSFWDEEELYPTEGDFAVARLNPLQAPDFARGMKL